jgi:hypothetical protein
MVTGAGNMTLPMGSIEIRDNTSEKRIRDLEERMSLLEGGGVSGGICGNCTRKEAQAMENELRAYHAEKMRDHLMDRISELWKHIPSHQFPEFYDALGWTQEQYKTWISLNQYPKL